jgi:hypothetical protein
MAYLREYSPSKPDFFANASLLVTADLLGDNTVGLKVASKVLGMATSVGETAIHERKQHTASVQSIGILVQ